jgi:hypothetical protein
LSRDYTLTEIITLPVLDTAGARALTQRLLAAARRESVVQADLLPTRKATHHQGPYDHLPEAVAAAREALETREAELAAASVAQLEGTRDLAKGRAADVRLDNGWAAFDLLCNAWERIPDHPEASAAAHQVRQVIYGQGLAFTQLPWEEEWAKSDERLTRLGQPDLTAAVSHVPGAAVFVKAIRDAQEAYGPAIGLTRTGQPQVPPPSLREPLANLTAAIRSYVLQTLAFGDAARVPKARALAEHLLLGLASWTGKKAAGPAAPAEAPPADPAATAAPVKV